MKGTIGEKWPTFDLLYIANKIYSRRLRNGGVDQIFDPICRKNVFPLSDALAN